MIERTLRTLAHLIIAIAEVAQTTGQHLHARADRIDMDRRLDLRRREGVTPWQTR